MPTMAPPMACSMVCQLTSNNRFSILDPVLNEIPTTVAIKKKAIPHKAPAINPRIIGLRLKQFISVFESTDFVTTNPMIRYTITAKTKKIDLGQESLEKSVRKIPCHTQDSRNMEMDDKIQEIKKRFDNIKKSTSAKVSLKLITWCVFYEKILLWF